LRLIMRYLLGENGDLKVKEGRKGDAMIAKVAK
jgi:hypothetical protein